MSHARRDDELDGVLLYGDGWDDPNVRNRLKFHLGMFRERKDDTFLISQDRYWMFILYRQTDSPNTIKAFLGKPCGEAYFNDQV